MQGSLPWDNTLRYLVLLTQSFYVYLSLAWNSWAFCPRGFLSAEITGVCHHTQWLQRVFYTVWRYLMVLKANQLGKVLAIGDTRNDRGWCGRGCWTRKVGLGHERNFQETRDKCRVWGWHGLRDYGKNVYKEISQMQTLRVEQRHVWGV